MPMMNPPQPGLSVRHDCLEPLGLTVPRAPAMLGVSRNQLSDLLNGHAGISPEMATRLDKAFGGGGAGTRYRLRTACHLTQAMKNADPVRSNRPSTTRPGAMRMCRRSGWLPAPSRNEAARERTPTVQSQV